KAAAMGGRYKGAEIRHAAIGRIDRFIVGYVVAVVTQRRWVEWQQPDRGCAEFLDVVEALHEAGEVTDPVIVRILESLHMQLVDNGILVPVGERFSGERIRKTAQISRHLAPPGGNR